MALMAKRGTLQTIFLTAAIWLFASLTVCAQDICPANTVCLPQATANKLLDSVNALIEAKTLIAKLMTERGASDVVIASAQRVIADYAQLNEINGQMVIKYKDALTLYERIMTLQTAIIEKLEKRLDAPKSAWQKLVAIVEKVVVLLAGVAIGSRASIIH